MLICRRELREPGSGGSVINSCRRRLSVGSGQHREGGPKGSASGLMMLGLEARAGNSGLSVCS